MKHIRISDATMKQSSEDFRLTFKERIELSKLLDKLGADIIELEGIKTPRIDALQIKSICAAVSESAIAVPVVLALVYSAMLAFGGDYTEFGNFAFKVDNAVLSAILPADNPFVVKPSHYTWFATSLMFAAMTLAGYHATEILRGEGGKRSKAVKLFAYGAALEAFGWAVSPWIPVIKPIFTLSFTAQAMGWCVISLAVLYVLADILMLRKGTGIVILFGQCALTAYLVGGFFRPVLAKLAEILTQGFPHAFGTGAAMPVVVAVAVAIEIAAVLAVRRRLSAR